ncbi:hypothetical protein PHISCL_02131 [Aspergillus sclerotialis]|uniref:Uncharacterized protein n=1 Tax=Aspergillus sclerotialis TaxID=2070753 RepID=A0A3A2ZQT6_9EURO|nr:hypothetical protein PHISCL_02131 [Aspergillus sclerotialis]
MGLDPSVYGGGGSPSSGDFRECSPSWSRVRDALVSATIGDEDSDSKGSSRGGGGPSAEREGDDGLDSEGKNREEKGGG